ncbi:6149_t:CDS:2 [Ambispora leptoticha]|uniref:Protein transport protein SFT2 n=1 Tax=Ambispora leptoticha TaxID=144679 RepID=A0A9N8ZI74_9GLOM|nr:6149_t:CDS:2 [Ambispora leptoticha]
MKFWDSADFSDQGTMDETSPFDCFKLTRTQRFVISFLSTLALSTGNITGFAILYTIGNVVSLVSTGFLVGFGKQIKTMFAPVRRIASAVFLAAMLTTLLVAFLVTGQFYPLSNHVYCTIPRPILVQRQLHPLRPDDYQKVVW